MALSAHMFMRGSATRFYAWLDTQGARSLPDGENERLIAPECRSRRIMRFHSFCSSLTTTLGIDQHNIAILPSDLLLLLSTPGDSASTVWDESHSAKSTFMPASGDPGRKAAWRAKHALQ
jgi:hypothetical protein